MQTDGQNVQAGWAETSRFCRRSRFSSQPIAAIGISYIYIYIYPLFKPALTYKNKSSRTQKQGGAVYLEPTCRETRKSDKCCLMNEEVTKIEEGNIPWEKNSSQSEIWKTAKNMLRSITAMFPPHAFFCKCFLTLTLKSSKLFQ